MNLVRKTQKNTMAGQKSSRQKMVYGFGGFDVSIVKGDVGNRKGRLVLKLLRSPLKASKEKLLNLLEKGLAFDRASIELR